MPDRTTYAILIHLPATVLEAERSRFLKYSNNYKDLVDQKTLFEKKMLAEEARARGLKVALIFDYFVQEPYHGKPPHVSAQDGKIVRSNVARAQGLGYLPFAWKEGWKYAQTAVEVYVSTINPDFIQQGIDHATMNWYRSPDATPPKPHWGYNDVMGMFNQGIKLTDWIGTYVVSAYYSNTLRKARDYFGVAITDQELLKLITFDLGDVPPPPDDDDDVPPPPDDDDVPPPDDDVEYVTKAQLVEVMMGVADYIDRNANGLQELGARLEIVESEINEINAALDDRKELLDRLEGVLGWLL